MGKQDELFVEKSVIAGAQSWIRPGTVSGDKIADGAITKAKMAATALRSVVSIPLPAFLANNTIYAGLLNTPAGKSLKIVKAELAAYTPPIDADGTCLVHIVNYDASATADDEVVASWNAEGLVAKTGTALTVITAGAVNVTGEHDYLYAELINNSAAIDTPWVAPVLTLEVEEQ